MPPTAPDRKGILELLDHGSNLTTPAFQRTFAWARQQIDEFWTDLKRALDAQPTDEYFLGLIVLDTTDQIQDGQQRLATTLLFASEISKRIDAAKAAGSHDPQLAIDATAAVASALRQNPSAPLRISAQDQEVLLNRGRDPRRLAGIGQAPGRRSSGCGSVIGSRGCHLGRGRSPGPGACATLASPTTAIT
jgi:hypothetical protein